MNPPELETDSENYPGNKSWRRVRRSELYAKVPSEPMVKIAKECGRLAKTCKRLDLPIPPRGYWAKLPAGKTVSKLPLPAAKPMTSEQWRQKVCAFGRTRFTLRALMRQNG